MGRIDCSNSISKPAQSVSIPYARKRFGQHFLVDPAVIDQIIDLIAPAPAERMIEIGPGRGALTLPLVEHRVHLTVIEIDRLLASAIGDEFGDEPGFKIEIEDALNVDYPALIGANRVRVVGNLPYNISTPLILKLISHHALIHDMTFMLQKEVVDRLCAVPCTKAYGRLSVMVQSQAQVEACFEVSPLAFAPPPKVTSKLVRITPQSNSLSANAQAQLESNVRAAFGQRRKTVKNTLGKIVPHEILAASGIDLAQRAEEISVDTYVRLAKALCSD